MAVDIKSYNQILGGMVKKILADTSLSDMRVGSVISTILEAAAQSDFEIHASIVQLLQLFSIDTTTGSDLDLRSSEFSVYRQTAAPSSGFVTIGDSSFKKKSSKIYIGLPPPVVGDEAINVEDASSFPTSGHVYIGRGTGNYEGPIAYTSLTNNSSYWTVNLSAPVTKNHTAVETVILAQGGNRTIGASTVVRSPANNFSPAVSFIVTRPVTLVDGETSIDNVAVTSQTAGTLGNVPAGSIVQFAALPFSGATVTNAANFNNGQDVETDSSLRARVRNAIKLIARGTRQSIIQAVVGVSDTVDNKRVTSASLTEPTSATTPAQLYIDDGTGFEPSYTGQGVEKVVDSAAGTEQFVQVSNFPLTPPILESATVEPFDLQPGMALDIRLDQSEETIIFDASDFKVPGLVRASEIIDAINSRSTLVNSRGANGVGVALIGKRFSDGTDPEELQVTGGTANSVINFPLTISRVMSLYKNGILLKKNPASAILFSTNSLTWAFSQSAIEAVLQLAVDNTPGQNLVIRNSDFSQFGVTYKTATAEQWAKVLTSKIPGVTVTVVSGKLFFSSNKLNSSASSLSVTLATDLTARQATAAVWHSGTLVRYTTTDTTNIVAGDQITVTGFSNAANNGVFSVTRVATNDYVEVTSTRSNSSLDETGVSGANINPNKEDLALIFFGSAVSSVGQSSDYSLNRFSGEVQLTKTLSLSDNLTAGSQFTSAHVDSLLVSTGKYNFPIQQDVNAELILSIDSKAGTRALLLANGDTLTQTRVGMSATDVTLASNRTGAFENLQVGDYIYVATKSTSGSSLSYSQWFPSYATGVFQITSIVDGQTVTIKNPDTSFVAPITGTVSSLTDIQAFFTDGLVQAIPLAGTNLLPSDVANQINSSLLFGTAVVFNGKLVRVQSNALDQEKSKIYILATAGTANTLFSSGTSAVATQPHIGFQVAEVAQTSFPRLKDGMNGLLSNFVTRGLVSGSTTSSDLSQPYVNIDSSAHYSTQISIGDSVKYQDGLNSSEILAIRSIDSDTQLTPQEYSGINPIFQGDRYIVTESHQFSPYDKLIVELDGDSTNKTFLIPMYRTGRVTGTPTTANFDALDMDSASGTDFNNAIWRDFDFKDFAVHFRARNIYKASSSDSSLIIRSTAYGEVGENLKFSVLYPTTPSQVAYAIHSVTPDHTQVNFYLASGAKRNGISNVGSAYYTTLSGQNLTITWAGIGPNPNFSGNGVVVGDIANISDPSFAVKSSLLIGSGKVTAASSSSITVKLPSSGSISTSYSSSAAADSGAGVTTTYSMSNTGLISLGDKVVVSGFSRSANNGTFTVVGVSTNSSIVVNHSNRTTISNSTSGYRRTSNVVSVQFSGSISGQVFVGDQVIVSNMSEPTINGNFTVSGITTTTVANDTIQYTSSGSTLPASRSVTTAIWQSGNTVRYSATNTDGIAFGNTVTVTGFTNSDNNGTFVVTGVSTNNWIELTTTRANSADDETSVSGAVARPTYFMTDTGGQIVVINDETTSATINLAIVQSTSSGISAFPLAGTTAASMASTINSNPIVSTVITAVNALGFSGSGVISNSTADEPSSVGYNHTPGQTFIGLYDGLNHVLDFYSASVNPQRNFSLKTPMDFSHANYDIATAPNVSPEQPGEYFKLVPMTFRNVEDWFNKTSVTSFSNIGTAGATADNGKLQLASQTIGTAGAVQVTGGGANGIQTFVKIPATVDGGAIRVEVNGTDLSMFTKGSVVKVENSIPSRKMKNFITNDKITVTNINGTTGQFRAEKRNINLANTNAITVTDVSASYGRSSGIIWRWTASNLPAAPFSGTQVGDVLSATNSNLSSGNRTSSTTGYGAISQFPIVGVDSAGAWIEVQNPKGVAQSSTVMSGTLNISVSPAFFLKWNTSITSGDTMQVSQLGLKNLWKYSWLSGTSAPKFAQNGASLDDYVVIAGNTFLPENRGTFRLVALEDSYFVVENKSGVEESSTQVDLVTDLQFIYSESMILGDKLNVSDLGFLQPNRGVFSVNNFGTDATTMTQFVEVKINNSSTQSNVILSGQANTFFVTDGDNYSSYRYVTNFSTDPTDKTKGVVYIDPPTNVAKISNSYNTALTPIQKLGFGDTAAIGIDGYRYYIGLLATVQRVVDGYDPDPTNFPGYRAAGTQIETVPPLKRRIFVNAIVKPLGGINLSALSDAIKASVLNYINSLGVGDSVIVSEITSAVMSVEGVQSVTLVTPDPTTESIVLQANERAVIKIDDITVSS